MTALIDYERGILERLSRKEITWEQSLFTNDCIVFIYVVHSIPPFSESGLYCNYIDHWFTNVPSSYFIYTILNASICRRELNFNILSKFLVCCFWQNWQQIVVQKWLRSLFSAQCLWPNQTQNTKTLSHLHLFAPLLPPLQAGQQSQCHDQEKIKLLHCCLCWS